MWTNIKAEEVREDHGGAQAWADPALRDCSCSASHFGEAGVPSPSGTTVGERRSLGGEPAQTRLPGAESILYPKAAVSVLHYVVPLAPMPPPLAELSVTRSGVCCGCRGRHGHGEDTCSWPAIGVRQTWAR